MRRLPLAGLSFLLATSAAWADSFRCGSKLVTVGETGAAVVEKCGEPVSKETITEDVMVRNANGTMRKTGETTAYEMWRYARGRNQYPAILTVRDGVVRSIEFGK
jgi:hypothetical protein